MNKRRFLVILVFGVCAVARGGSTPPFTVSPVNFSGTPSLVTLGSDGNLWIYDSSAKKIIRWSASGESSGFALPTSNAILWDMTLGPDGNVWGAESNVKKLGRITPDGAITEFPVTSGRQPEFIAAGGDGNVWFAESQSLSNGMPPTYFVARISTADDSIKEFPALTGQGRINGGMVTGADGNLWVLWAGGGGTSPNKIIRVNTEGTATGFNLPASTDLNSLLGKPVLGPDGNVWFAYANNIARVTPAGTVTVYPVPTANARPLELAIGTDGNLWFSELEGKRIGQLVVKSATASGQATINESDALDFLPSSILLLPAAGLARSAKVGELADTIDCSQLFVVVGQKTTRDPGQMMKLSGNTPGAACADIAVTFAGNGLIAHYTTGNALNYDLGFQFKISNGGPSKADAVRVVGLLFPGPGGMQINSVETDDGQTCMSTADSLDCNWASFTPGEKHFIKAFIRFPANTDWSGRWDLFGFSDTYDPNPVNNHCSTRFNRTSRLIETLTIQNYGLVAPTTRH